MQKGTIKMLSIPKWVCKFYLRQLDKAVTFEAKEIGLLDKEKTNTYYQSKRSNMGYTYLDTRVTRIMDKLIACYLWLRTGENFYLNINKLCAPINSYVRGGSIKVHRDRNMLTGKPVKYIATICLSQSKEGGDFFYNENVFNCSDDGKIVWRKEDADKIVPLSQGKIVILRNADTVHGVTEILEGRRKTLTFRSN